MKINLNILMNEHYVDVTVRLNVLVESKTTKRSKQKCIHRLQAYIIIFHHTSVKDFNIFILYFIV